MRKIIRAAVSILALAAVCMNVPAFASESAAEEMEGAVKEEEMSEEPEGGYTIDNIRSFIVGIDEPVTLRDGTQRALINFDNAATTPAFVPVRDAVDKELNMYGSIGRGFSLKSNHSTDLTGEVRRKVLKFLHADSFDYECVFVNNTTDGLNKLASALITDKDDVVLTTRMEHHSNDLSWRERCRVIYAEVDEKGRIQYDEIERLLKENQVKIVSVTAASNVTGYITDVHRVAKLAHQYGAVIVVDGAQIVAHRSFSMVGETPEENIDFFVFSAHKMYSPYGGGAIVGVWEQMENIMPAVYGGGTVEMVGDDWQRYKTVPGSFEAGSPNYPGIVGLGKAIDVLTEIGYDDIAEHEQRLTKRMIDGLLSFDNVKIYGDSEKLDDRVGVVSIGFPDNNSFLVAEELAEAYGTATRRGAFCAHPYVWRLMGIPDDTLEEYEACDDMNTPGMLRVSFGIYNTEEEVDEFLDALAHAMETTKKNLEEGAAAEIGF